MPSVYACKIGIKIIENEQKKFQKIYFSKKYMNLHLELTPKVISIKITD